MYIYYILIFHNYFMQNNIVPYNENCDIASRYSQASQMGLASIGAALVNNLGYKVFNYESSPARKRSKPNFFIHFCKQ